PGFDPARLFRARFPFFHQPFSKKECRMFWDRFLRTKNSSQRQAAPARGRKAPPCQLILESLEERSLLSKGLNVAVDLTEVDLRTVPVASLSNEAVPERIADLSSLPAKTKAWDSSGLVPSAEHLLTTSTLEDQEPSHDGTRGGGRLVNFLLFYQ